MIDTTKKITSVSVDGVSMALAGGSYIITAAELPSNVLKLYQGSTLIDTQTIVDAPIEFSVSAAGTYTVKAYDAENNELWTNDITLDDIGIYNCKSGKTLTNYTVAEIHTICQNGLFSTMFSLKDKWNYTQTGSIFNNKKFFVEKITQTEDGKEIVDFRNIGDFSSTYNINPNFAYLSSVSDTAFKRAYSSNGGYKHSVMRQRMLKVGESMYMQATGIKPDGSTIVGGIEFSNINYTNGGKSGLYSYNKATDTMTLLSDFAYNTSSNGYDCQFIKGYFKSVGAIDETTFNTGNYYTYKSSSGEGIYCYTPATTWVSGTTYYGFYETMQEDGIFVAALSSIESNLVRFEDYSSTGMTNTTTVAETEDYVDIPCVEEITGTNRTTILFSGNNGVSIGSYNIANEGTKKPAYDDFQIQAIGDSYWTRSANSYGSSDFCCISYGGYIYGTGVNVSTRARVGFRLS